MPPLEGVVSKPDKLAYRIMKLTRLYARLPTLACQQRCQASCGPILMGAIEYLRLLHASNATQLASTQGTMVCPLLKDGLCSVYLVRPMICRLWGLTKSMACPHGCVPERWLSEEESNDLLQASYEISSGEIAGIVPEESSERHAVAVRVGQALRRRAAQNV